MVVDEKLFDDCLERRNSVIVLKWFLERKVKLNSSSIANVVRRAIEGLDLWLIDELIENGYHIESDAYAFLEFVQTVYLHLSSLFNF